MVLSERSKHRDTIGTLTLSGGQLVFSRTDGLFSKTERIVTTIPMNVIANVNVEGRFGKKLVIIVDKMKMPGIPRYEFEVGDPYNWMNTINNEIAAQMNLQMQSQPTREVYVKEITKEIVKVPCKFCGCLNPMTDKKCSSCGAPIQ
jgi:hypothetical protein